MQTTIEIPDELFREAERCAALECVPVESFIEQSLRRVLAEHTSSARRRLTFPLHRSTHPGALTSAVVRAAEAASANEEDAHLADAM